MASAKSVWGIDLGQAALKAIQMRPAGDQVQVTNHVYFEHAKILSQPDVDRQVLIEEAMKLFTDRHDLSKETLVVSVPGQHTLARFTKLPPVDKKKIPEIVKYEAQQQIPFDPDEVIWDYQTFEQPETMETEVGIFAMRRELLRDHLYFLTSLNLEPAAVQSAPLALYNALRFDGLCGSEPVAILDIGTQNTDLIVADGDSLWTRNIPIGGNKFTEALLKTFKLSFRKAENLKRSAASSKYARQIFQAMRPVFADLVAEVQRSIGFFTSSRRGMRLSRMIAMGNAFKLPGLQKFLQQNLGMDVTRPKKFSRLLASEAPNATELADQLLSFGVAYGLGLQGLGKSSITSNLLPVEIAKQVVWRKKTPWFYGTAAALVLSASALWWSNFRNQGLVEEGQGTKQDFRFSPQYNEDDQEQKNPLPDPNAIRVIDTGITASSSMDMAHEVVSVGRHLSDVWSTLQGMNEEGANRAKDIAKLQVQKSVWPRLLHLIHSVLPAGDKQLAEKLAEGTDAYKAFIEANPEKYARDKREQIFIQHFDAVYSNNVMSDYWLKRNDQLDRGQSHGSRDIGRVKAGSDDKTPKPGFVVTLVGQTPNKGGHSFVNRTLVLNLRASAKKEEGFYMEEPYQTRCIRIKDMGQGGEGRLSRRYDRERSRFARETSSGESSRGSAAEETKDPVTGESTQNDSEFEVILAVVLAEEAPEKNLEEQPDE